MELLVVLVILGAGIAGLFVVYRRATRRTGRRLAAARQAHQQALEQLAVRRPGLRLVAPDGGEGWAALEGTLDGTWLRLSAGAELQRSTFIRHFTLLWVKPRRQLTPGLHLDLSHPGLAAGLLQTLPEELQQETLRLISSLCTRDGQLVLTARPGGAVTHHYSYGYHLLLVPQALDDLLALGMALDAQLDLSSADGSATTR